MSNIFLKNNFDNMFDSITESNLSLPQWITVIDNANKTTKNENNNSNKLRKLLSETSEFEQAGGKYSATSSDYVQAGGYNQAGGNNNTFISNDFNKLVSMLTSESNSATPTATLEDQLKNMLNQNGGSSHSRRTNVNDVKQFFYDLKSQGVDVNVKLNDRSMSEFFGLAQNTTTDLNSTQLGNLLGGKGMNPGFQAFLDLKKFIAKELDISNGPMAAKVAGAVQKEMKEKHTGLDAVQIAAKGKKHFEENKDKYKKMLK